MQKPIQVTFRNVPPLDAAEDVCRQEAEKLERYHERITSCHVFISQPHKHHRHGNPFQVRIEIAVPGGEVVVHREPGEHQQHEDGMVVIREAFDAARRQLEDLVRRQRGDVKHHER